MADERDWGPIMALMAHLYHMGPWDVERLTPEQLSMYLEQSGSIRLMRDIAALQYSFSKYDAEARQKLVSEADKKHDPDSIDARAWRVYVRQYQTDSEEAEQASIAERLPLSQAAATALVGMIETGELTREYGIGSTMWRLRVLPIWQRLLTTAQA